MPSKGYCSFSGCRPRSRADRNERRLRSFQPAARSNQLCGKPPDAQIDKLLSNENGLCVEFLFSAAFSKTKEIVGLLFLLLAPPFFALITEVVSLIIFR